MKRKLIFLLLILFSAKVFAFDFENRISTGISLYFDNENIDYEAICLFHQFAQHMHKLIHFLITFFLGFCIADAMFQMGSENFFIYFVYYCKNFRPQTDVTA